MNEINKTPHGNSGLTGRRMALFTLVALAFVLLALEGIFRVFNIGEGGPVDIKRLDIKHDVADFVGFLEMDINIHGKKGGASLYIEDPDLMWKLRPEFTGRARDFFAVSVSDEAPEWSFSINRRGFRGRDFEIEREPGVYRIVALGDSCTFGFGVDPGDAYPERLQAILERICPSCRFEVINLGAPGYTSEQGVLLARKWLSRLNPQTVIISYGTNDWWKRRFSDENELKRLNTAGAKLGRLARKSALVHGIEALISRGRQATSPGEAALVPRVSVERYGVNIEQIAEIAEKAGARVILMDNNFYVPYGTESLITIQRDHPDYALVDAVGILASRLRDPDEIRRRYPVSTNIAIRQYSRVIQDRPMFLLMVDPVHPNAIGNEIIAEVLARVILRQGDVPRMVEERRQYTLGLPRIKALGGGFLERTALEQRAAVSGEE